MSNHQVLVIGRNGQVANHIMKLFGNQVARVGLPEIDLVDRDKTLQYLKQFEGSWKWLIIAAAYTQVDMAEQDRDLCWKVNAQAPGWIGSWARENNARVIHFSSDYVYSGEGQKPFVETDKVAPLNYYGESKAAGDQALLESCSGSVILRTSWVYSEFGHNFVKTILRLVQEKESLRIVSDQIGAPTSAQSLAFAARAIVKDDSEATGVFHFTDVGEVSWFDFATEIWGQARARGLPVRCREILPIPASEYPTAAKRPANSRLSLSKWNAQFSFRPRPWTEALSETLDELCKL